MNELSLEKITKRIMLSEAHRVFDPIGYTVPVMLCPKLMLQKVWKMSIGWDTEITSYLRKEFLQWFQEELRTKDPRRNSYFQMDRRKFEALHNSYFL
ncbi:hypothetical protein AVEN_2950-1 [Araneus ventricosus]|uniref:Uncharacterized protein n=1 Tax=Araneus ventricosus TaxID=182803 RepID=A0A4Y2IMU1_ARAVE|nr:hypothetical protein AVEN_2950-1 [Araneus ventricosus]